MEIWDPPYEIPIKIGLKDDDGKEVPVELQIVREAVEHLRGKNIPFAHVGYDGSMRSGIVQAFTLISHEFHALDSMGGATERPVQCERTQGEGKKREAEYPGAMEGTSRPPDFYEFWFATASPD